MTNDAAIRTAYHYNGESEWARLGAIDKADNIVRLCADVPHARLLEIGAGEGAVLSRLAELGFGEACTAIDVAESGVAAIRERAIPTLVDSRSFDGETIPYADDAFDLAILSHVVEQA
jgi:2-polyprenyl-3-methyl-5-hydroxy-6-metoxy-1,4-benzoquinol methylase